MSTVDSATSGSAATALGSAAGPKQTASEQTDRFLKLLVTQMQNQDPLNPMDNAQITTQMAQISTVSGIDDLNKSIGTMTSTLFSSQSMQAASLIGKNVLVPGNTLALDAEGKTAGGLALAGAADKVSVNIKDAYGKVIDTVELGAQKPGRISFDWTSPKKTATGLTFEIDATVKGVKVDTQAMVSDVVRAVYADGGQLAVELARTGVVNYGDIKAVVS
jgi:flagellar basal-body rod modification protein FlgD